MNKLFPVPVGLNGVTPQIRSLDASSESLSTIINPGFLNSVIAMGNQIDPDDMLLISYANGTQFFSQSIADGVITLSPANDVIPFPFTNVQFVAKGGSDLNAGNTLNAPKLTIPAALSAITAGGMVWVLDSGNYSIPFTMPANVVLYMPTARLTYSNAAGSLITFPDTGTSYTSLIFCADLEVTGGANAITQNGALSGLLIQAAAWSVGPATFNGTASINVDLLPSSVLTFTATGAGLLNIGFAGGASSVVVTTPGSVVGKFGDTYYNTQTFLNQIISQNQQTQETVGRTLVATDSNTTVNYMNTTTGTYVFPATGIPVGTKGSFTQLSSGHVQFNSDGTSTILSYLNTSPVLTNSLNAKADWEQISQGVYMISGNIIGGGP